MLWDQINQQIVLNWSALNGDDQESHSKRALQIPRQKFLIYVVILGSAR